MIFTFACLMLLYSGFCRLVHTSLTTRLELRLAVYGLTVSALVGLYAALFQAYDPGWPGTLIVAAMVVVQVVTARLWRFGVPAPFATQRSEP